MFPDRIDKGDQAVRSLQDVENANLNGLLRASLCKIFKGFKSKGRWREYEVENGQ